MPDNAVRLTSEQQQVLDFAKTAHNVCIFGGVGVGKSTLVDEIRKTFARNGIKYQIVCSSGISCGAYRGIAKTVHSHYGLQTAELPSRRLLERSLEQANVSEQVKNTEVLIWDEVSMSSARLLSLVNVIHQKLLQNNYPLGGIQVILVGDFWQLKPIPSPVDSGIPVYESILFNKVFPHRFELTRVLRQEDSERRLKSAIDVLRSGQCDNETERYLCSLSRDFDSCENGRDPVHIYFRRLPVGVHNSSILASMPGKKLRFDSVDTGITKSLDKTVSAVLSLKPGCQVMLLYNVNSLLKNGVCGRFVGVDSNDDGIVVNFPEVGMVMLERKTWFKYDAAGKVLASRTQYPLSLCYAITVHKAQSLTMERIVVHCSQEFIAGQTYVAISRVRKEEAVKVVGFRKRFLLPPPPALDNVAMCQFGNPVSTFTCCKNGKLDESFSKLVEDCQYNGIDREEDGVSDSEVDVVSEEHESTAREEFESNAAASVNLEDVLLCMSDFTHELSHPPSDFSLKEFLDPLVCDVHVDPFSQTMKSAAQYAVNNLDTFQLLACILWCRIGNLFQDYLTENPKETHMTNRNFTCATTKLNELFITNDYRNDMIRTFNVHSWVDINNGQRILGMQIVFHLYKIFTAEVRKRVQKQEDQDPICFQVNKMEADGLGKIRYVGGWAINKSLGKSRRYASCNKWSDCEDALAKVKREMKKVSLLEDNVIIPLEILQHSTSVPDTLNVTETRQFRERGLLHISDGAYQFFLSLEQQRVDKINLTRLVSLQKDLVDVSIELQMTSFYETNSLSYLI